MRFLLALVVLVVSLSGCEAPLSPRKQAHVDKVKFWYAERDERLIAEDGWLTVVGLHWLDDGDYEVGREGDIAYEGFADPVVGTLVFRSGVLGFKPAPGVEVLGVPESGLIETDEKGRPTVLRTGTCEMYVIRRGDRYAVRIRDSAAPARLAFEGVERFPINFDYMVRASFERPDPGDELTLESIVGTESSSPIAGYAVFIAGGQSYRMVLLPGDDERHVFVVFADQTTGKSTYGGGRFLEAEITEDGRGVVLDFNRAYNPPCAFTPYATCPIPPADNILLLPIEAGEKTPAGY